MRTLLLAVCGIGIGTGLCLAYTVRHPAPARQASAQTPTPLLVRRALLALALAALVYAVTRWISAIPITAAGVWYLPRMLGPDTQYQQELAVVDAVAVFAEMLRDTLSAATGLNQAGWQRRVWSGDQRNGCRGCAQCKREIRKRKVVVAINRSDAVINLPGRVGNRKAALHAIVKSRQNSIHVVAGWISVIGNVASSGLVARELRRRTARDQL